MGWVVLGNRQTVSQQRVAGTEWLHHGLGAQQTVGWLGSLRWSAQWGSYRLQCIDALSFASKQIQLSSGCSNSKTAQGSHAHKVMQIKLMHRLEL